ncbi:MAG TPA: T9SS type A sorting domain-containing protein, partial [Chitinophagaceae bacterium]|nr:T9SS type A sorting domain-containing protein [Chitinophagaceae bacterium]
TAPATPSFGGQLVDIEGDLIIKSTGTGAIYLANSFNYFTTVGGDYIQTGGTLVLNQTGGIGALSLEGNFNMSGGVLARNSPGAFSSSTIYFDGNAEQTFTKTGGTISGPLDFEISAGSSVNFGTSVLNASTADFRLNDGAKIIISHPAGLNSAGAVGSIQTATRSFSADADYEFRGPVTGIFNTGGSTNITASEVRNLIINNTSGSVTLSKPVTISNDEPGIQRLYLQNGALITTATNILTLEDNVQATGTEGLNPNLYNLNSFVDGPLRKIGDDDFMFPVGKVGFGLHKIGIDFTGALNNTTAFTARFFRSSPKALSTTLGAGLERISGCEYWTLDRTGTTPARVVLSWESTSGCGGQYVTDLLTLSVARLNAANTWVDEGNQIASRTGTAAAGTITSNNIVNNFSPFALASSSAAANPLPVVFGDVKAYENNNGVQIEWSNLTEKDVAEYTIERSANGSDFNSIASQLPTSNQNDKASYSGFDATPVQGTNYYRIKAEETTGKIVYSKILSVSLGKASYGLRLYPNPVKDNQVTISLSNMKRGQYNLRVVSATGQDVFKKMIINQSNNLTQTLDLPSTIKPGVYNMVITADDYRETKMFIVQ